jgi:hypothetical protein
MFFPAPSPESFREEETKALSSKANFAIAGARSPVREARALPRLTIHDSSAIWM